MRLKVRTVYRSLGTVCCCSVWRSTPIDPKPSLSVVTTEFAGWYHCSSPLPSRVCAPVRMPVLHFDAVTAALLNSSSNIRSHCAPAVTPAGGASVAGEDGELGPG